MLSTLQELPAVAADDRRRAPWHSMTRASPSFSESAIVTGQAGGGFCLGTGRREADMEEAAPGHKCE